MLFPPPISKENMPGHLLAITCKIFPITFQKFLKISWQSFILVYVKSVRHEELVV